MRREYEPPCLVEAAIGTEDVMLFSGDLIRGGTDPYAKDIGWDRLL